MAKNSAILHDRFPFYSGSFPDNITGSIRKVEKSLQSLQYVAFQK